ncbi:MAG: shikimate kinase [Fidelibacterota bacterium]
MKKIIRNIYLIGMTGAGKTTVGKILANKLEWAFVDVNETMEAVYGRSLKEIFDTFGEESFRNMEATMLQELSQGEHQVFACNSGSVIDEKKLQTMKRTGIIIWIDVSLKDLIRRVEKMDRPAVSEGDVGKTVRDMMQDFRKYYEQADLRLATDGTPPEVAADQILQILKQIGQ